MNNTLSSLNNYLFEQLERLTDDSLTPEQLKQEIDRTKAGIRRSDHSGNNVKLTLQAMRFADEKLPPDAKMPAMLEVDTNGTKV